MIPRERLPNSHPFRPCAATRQSSSMCEAGKLTGTMAAAASAHLRDPARGVPANQSFGATTLPLAPF